MGWLVTACGLFVASIVLAFLMLRRSYDSQPKRPPTLTEEYLRNRALNDNHRPKARQEKPGANNW